jgi:predicted enzyme related to lactoylglutathione lyase
MEREKIKRMTGLIMSSANPNRLTTFYKEVMGLPLMLNKHGNMPEHWECDFEGIHYAILRDRNHDAGSCNFVPSFEVEDIKQFVTQHNLSMLHPLMHLGGGDYVGSIADADGNIVRLWMTTKKP